MIHYEADPETFTSDAYTVDGWARGVAWRALGWQTEATEDTEWTGFEDRTGKVVIVMVGDDRHFTCDPDDLTPLDRKEYCGSCGQVGCAHDGYDRE